MPIVNKVENFLKEYNIDGKVICAISGGCDSVVMTYILSKLGLEVVAIHLNHNWRGEEALREQEVCRLFASAKGFEFFTKTAKNIIPTIAAVYTMKFTKYPLISISSFNTSTKLFNIKKAIKYHHPQVQNRYNQIHLLLNFELEQQELLLGIPCYYHQNLLLEHQTFHRFELVQPDYFEP